jgi:hypothetical protein
MTVVLHSFKFLHNLLRHISKVIPNVAYLDNQILHEPMRKVLMPLQTGLVRLLLKSENKGPDISLRCV